ncbi:hypothetical protein Patl1_16883 [Pistacia atlantica]|uniref:Uncharacterized protein n=1 Tax=Pistacia atlantica TaxID=434234 RepID=A0ACC1B8H5_9ROSI|nr:hypothetical protein Patl1_16883 [Pistacia atlantica]
MISQQRQEIRHPPSTSSSLSIFTNYPLLSALVSFFIAQSIKFFTCWYKERRWDLKQLIGSGGMPSSHSATVTALALAIGLQEGFGGSLFAISLILACIIFNVEITVAGDVRCNWCKTSSWAPGRVDSFQVLNQIVYELPSEHPLAESRPLRELLGHTPPQVIAGGLLGIVTAVMGHVIIFFSGQS